MENDATGPGSSGLDPQAAEKLRQLEEEIARLKEQVGQQAGSPQPEAGGQAVVDGSVTEATQEVPGQTPEAAAKPLSATELTELDALIKQVHLARIRKQSNQATDLLKQAAEKWPNAPQVHEALGDDLLERKIYKSAAEKYAKALRLDPSNVALERKHADAVYYGEAAGLGLELGDDSYISPKAALILAVLLPGVPQMVSNKVAKGVVIMGGFIAALIVTAVIRSEGTKQGEDGKWLFLAPLIFAVVFWLWGVIDASTGATKPTAAAKRMDRPKPPVDLPFE